MSANVAALAAVVAFILIASPVAHAQLACGTYYQDPSCREDCGSCGWQASLVAPSLPQATRAVRWNGRFVRPRTLTSTPLTRAALAPAAFLATFANATATGGTTGRFAFVALDDAEGLPYLAQARG